MKLTPTDSVSHGVIFWGLFLQYAKSVIIGIRKAKVPH